MASRQIFSSARGAFLLRYHVLESSNTRYLILILVALTSNILQLIPLFDIALQDRFIVRG